MARGRGLVRNLERLHRLEDSASHMLGASSWRVRQQQRELPAAEASYQVRRTHASDLQGLCYGPQAFIARAVAIVLVEELEVVHIDQHQGDRFARAPGAQ